MRYTLEQNTIYEKPLLPVKIFPLSIMASLLYLGPFIYFITQACMHGWDDYHDDGSNNPSFNGVMALILFFVTIIAVFLQFGICERTWFAVKKPKAFFVRGFNPDYMHLDVYKEAYNDLIKEIESGNHEKNGWSEVFMDLNVEAERYVREEKKRKAKLEPRKDYAQSLKDFNDQYFGELNP